MKKKYILVLTILIIVIFSFFGCNQKTQSSNIQIYPENCNQLDLQSTYTGIESFKSKNHIFGVSNFYVNDLTNEKIYKTNFEEWKQNGFYKLGGRNQLTKNLDGKNLKIVQTDVVIYFVFPNQQILKNDKKEVVFDSRVKQINANIKIRNSKNETLANQPIEIKFNDFASMEHFNIECKKIYNVKNDIEVFITAESYITYEGNKITDKLKLDSLKDWLAISVNLIGKEI